MPLVVCFLKVFISFLLVGEVITLNVLIFCVFFLSFLITITFVYIDRKKKRVLTTKPFISFIVPTYNDSSTIDKTLESIFSSYDKNFFEIFVVNDKSTDDTEEVVKALQKKFDFTFVTNKKNLGKSRSINHVFKKTKGEIIFIVDSDSILRNQNVDEILSRLEDPTVGASSCGYRPANKGFLARMVEIDYGMLSFVQISHNLSSTVGLWGGCLAVKRKAFEQVGLFSENMLTEDMDMALKLGEHGWRVEESQTKIYTDVPTTFRSWYKQKLRWGAGFSQTFLKHYKYLLRKPLPVFFILMYSILAVLFIISTINNLLFIKNLYLLFEYFRATGNSFSASVGLLKISNGLEVFSAVGLYLLYPLFSLPYVLVHISSPREWYKVFLIFPYALIYFPAYLIVNVHGIVIGVHKYFTMTSKTRGW